MVEIYVQVPDKVLGELHSKLSNRNEITDIVCDALDLYTWVVQERAMGRHLVSTDNEGGSISRLTMPSLESVKSYAQHSK